MTKGTKRYNCEYLHTQQRANKYLNQMLSDVKRQSENALILGTLTHTYING